MPHVTDQLKRARKAEATDGDSTNATATEGDNASPQSDAEASGDASSGMQDAADSDTSSVMSGDEGEETAKKLAAQEMLEIFSLKYVPSPFYLPRHGIFR